jgi:DNA-binding MarR family transcriptional regulator
VQGSEEIADVVLRASRALVAIAARSLAGSPTEVTLPQYRALVLLCAAGPSTMRSLADSLSCSPSTATRLCDRLVAKGLVERQARADDRREVRVGVTRSGAKLVSTVTRRRRREIDRIVEAMPADRREELVAALGAFSAAAGEAPDQAWTTGWDL